MSAIQALPRDAVQHESSFSPLRVVDVDTTKTRVCTRCFERLPITEFRPRTKDAKYRHYRCNTCEREVERVRNRAWRAKLSRVKVREMMAKVRQARTDRAVEVAAAEMLAGFDREGGFAQAFKGYLEYAKYEARRFGRHGAWGKAMWCLCRLWIHADSRRAESLAARTDDELHARLLDAAHELVASRPESLVALLQAHGYTVTRRENTCDCEPRDTLS